MTKTRYTGVYYRDTKNNDRIFYITYKLNGKSFKDKVGSKKEGITSAYASKLRSKKVSEFRLGDDAPLKKAMFTLDEASVFYFESIIEKKDTKNSKNRYTNHIKNELGQYKLDKIYPDMIKKFVAKKKAQKSLKSDRLLSSTTVYKLVNIISTIYNYMINTKDLNIKNPASNKYIKRDEPDGVRQRYLELDEISKLFLAIENIQYAKNHTRHEQSVKYRLKMYTVLSLMTGARYQSIFTIMKTDVNLKQNIINIKNHKSKRDYIGFIHPKYKKFLADSIKDLKPTDYILSRSSKVLYKTSINRVLQPILNKLFNEDLDISDTQRRVVLHTFRHTFASHLAINGTPIYTIKKLLDHSDIKTTMRYAKLQPDAGGDAVAKLGF